MSILSGCTTELIVTGAKRIYTTKLKHHRMIIFPPMIKNGGFNKQKIQNSIRTAVKAISFEAKYAFSNEWKRNDLPYFKDVILAKDISAFYGEVEQGQDYFLRDYGRKNRYDLIIYSFISVEHGLAVQAAKVEMRCFLVDKKLQYPLCEKVPVSRATLENPLYWKERLMHFIYIFYADIEGLTKGSDNFRRSME